MKIVPYHQKYKNDFIEMNKAWISEMFTIEKEDIRELENIELYIEKGGQIFFALNNDDQVMACCMIAPREDGDWEIMKCRQNDLCWNGCRERLFKSMY